MTGINSEKTYKKSLAKKLLIVFLAFVFLFLVSSASMLYIVRLEINEYVVDFQEYKVREETERADDFVENTIDDLKSFYVLKDDISRNDFSLTTTHIYQLFLVNKSIEVVKIVSPSGDELSGVSRVGIIPQEQLGSAKDTQYFQQAKNNIIFYGKPRIEGKTVFADIAVPYFENFNLVAVVWARINLSPFFNELTSEITFNSGHLHILDASGIVLAAPDINSVGKDISKTELFGKLSRQKEVFGIECKQSCIEDHDFDTILSAGQVDGEYGFILALESDEKDVFELYYQIRYVVFIGALIFVAMSIILVVVIRARTQKYLNILIEGVQNLHEGKFSERIAISTGDELEYFADHFNDLAENIENKIKEKNQAIEKLTEVGVMKYNFITIVSHQLRTPVSSIMWLTETLISQIGGTLTNEQIAIFQDIYKSTQNISQIINDMILMADIDENKVVLEKSSANCDDIIASAMFGAQEQARKKEITIEYQKPKDPLPDCNGDVKKLKFIFVRILDNAIKYSNPGKKVIIKSEAKNKEIVFSVADNGIGIPQAEQSRIFIKFYRASNAYKMEQDASGLSLYISKYFIEMHGGQIWFDSKEGEGSTFYFSLPLK